MIVDRNEKFRRRSIIQSKTKAFNANYEFISECANAMSLPKIADTFIQGLLKIDHYVIRLSVCII